MRRTFLIYSLFALFFAACDRPSSLETPEYIKWCNASNELIKSNSMAGVYLWVKYIPSDFFVASGKQVESTNQSGLHFQVEIRTEDGLDMLSGTSGDPSYFERLSYINSKIQKDFKLIINQSDTLDCALAHLERTYGVGKDRISLEFPSEGIKKIESISFQYDDHLFQVGRINVNYSQKDLSHIPTLKL
tara:strand:- start:87 stop:653 length:567 start_codon:yes stop_codon:yes gene_type:complete